MRAHGVPRLKRLAGVLLCVAVGLFMLRWFEHHQVFIPTPGLDLEPTQVPSVEDVYMRTRDDVRINGWFLPARTQAPYADRVILLFHGNAGNISHRVELYDLLRDCGLNVLAVDYRGYGRSNGRPTEAGTYLDAEAAYDWLTQNKGFASTHIIPMGESLGCAVATELALRRSVGGLILQTPWLSLPELGAELFPWLPARRLCSIHYDTESKLPRIRVPLLVLHSRADTLIRFHHGQRNYDKANEPKMFRELQGDHNEALLVSHRAYAQGIREYLEKFFPTTPSASEHQ